MEKSRATSQRPARPWTDPRPRVLEHALKISARDPSAGDSETAEIAVQSALTGHLVFTTVHANNVFDVLSRFVHMGVDVYSFVASLNAILAQRLMRVICTECSESVTPTAEMLKAAGLPKAELDLFEWRAGRGCSNCRGTGYRGRKAVGELLVLNDEIREAIIAVSESRISPSSIKCRESCRFQ